VNGGSQNVTKRDGGLRFRKRTDPIGLIPGQGWEDKLQKQFEEMAREEFGIEIDDKVFLG
jgi:aarF domain-containing kinase